MLGTNNRTDRQQWIRSTLKAIKQGRILDAGAGELNNKQYCTHLEYVSQDFCGYDGKGDGTALQTKVWNTSKIDIVSDISSIPVEDSSFDYVLCTEVFEHIKYPVKALEEFHRVLKPGGGLIVTAPFCSITHMAPYHMYSGFNRYWYDGVLSDIGFKHIEIEVNGNWFDYISQEIRRVPFMAEVYSASRVKYLYKAAVLPMLLLLSFLNKKGNSSDELLCYGYHVTARKA